MNHMAVVVVDHESFGCADVGSSLYIHFLSFFLLEYKILDDYFGFITFN